MELLGKLFVISIVVFSRTKVFGFNIETRDPIVKRAKASSSNTYFGFSVAQHAVKEGSTDIDDYRILVGAPLGKNLQPNTNRSGALFMCPISNDPDDCDQVVTDGKRVEDEHDYFDYDDDTKKETQASTLQPPGKDEIKEDQWLGVTVKSQKPGGKVVVCAHRYIESDNISIHHYGKGLCYLLTNELKLEEVISPCKSRPTEKLHMQYGFCQAGTSLAMLDDGFAVIGSPGPLTWRGTIFATCVVGSYISRDTTVYNAPLNDTAEPIDKYSYLGMSSGGGHFFKKNVTSYVGGAPRSQFNGQVFIFDQVTSVTELVIRLILNGTQFASSFGYEVLTVDIDKDGYDELLVAAPFYYGKDVGGAVYLYRNIRTCTKTNCQPAMNLTGKEESRFGFAMASLGDINRDGYNDVAIGAPYERHSTSDSSGAIYIYLGSKNGLQSEPSQIIKHRSVRTMGYSMSAGLDMDVNGYPDLLVGAYEDERVILYKTRPIIDISIKIESDEIKNINASRRGCLRDSNTNKTCFSFKTCFTLSDFKITQELSIKSEVRELAKIPRVTFAEDGGSSVDIGHITVDDPKKTYCRDNVAYLVEGTGDILTPIKFQVNYSIQNDVKDSPILNKTSVKVFHATFQKNCGDDEVCRSKLILDAGVALDRIDDGYMMDLGKNKELILNINVSNQGESAYEAKLFIEHPEGLSFIKAEEKKTGVICTSNNESTLVTCNLGNPLQENHSLQLNLRFETTQIKQSKINLTIFVNSTSTETSTQTRQTINLIVQKIASYVIQGKGKPTNINYGGEVKGQSAMRYFEDIGPKVIHSYDVINKGQWTIENMVVTILWPYQVFTKRKEGGKWILYLEDYPKIINFKNITTCDVDQRDAVNPLKLSYLNDKNSDVEEPEVDQTSRRRRKRDVEEVISPETVIESDQKERKIVRMSCQGTALCATIRCFIPLLRENSEVKINISARMWNSTLMEDYSQVDWVSIQSMARIEIMDDTLIHHNNSIDATSIETKAYPQLSTDQGVNMWIIIGSVIAGLILLIVVIIVLYKCGFFKRKRIKDHTLSANLTKQGESETLLKDNDAKTAKR